MVPFGGGNGTPPHDLCPRIDRTLLCNSINIDTLKLLLLGVRCTNTLMLCKNGPICKWANARAKKV